MSSRNGEPAAPREALIASLDQGQTGCLVGRGVGGRYRVYVMLGEILAAQVDDDDARLLARLRAGRDLSSAQLAALRGQLPARGVVLESLFELLPEQTVMSLLFERFRENLLAYLLSDDLETFVSMDAVFTENIQVGHDSRTLVHELVEESRRTAALRAQPATVLAPGAAGPESEREMRILGWVGNRIRLSELLEKSSFEAGRTLDLVHGMLDRGVLVGVVPESRRKLAPASLAVADSARERPAPARVALPAVAVSGAHAPLGASGPDDAPVVAEPLLAPTPVPPPPPDAAPLPPVGDAAEPAGVAPVLADGMGVAEADAPPVAEVEPVAEEDDLAPIEEIEELPPEALASAGNAAMPEGFGGGDEWPLDEPTTEAPVHSLYTGSSVEDDELAAFQDYDSHRDGGAFLTERALLDRVELVDGEVGNASRPPTQETLIEMEDAESAGKDVLKSAVSLNFSGPRLQDDELRRKLDVTNEVLSVVAAALDSIEGAGAGQARLQLLIEGTALPLAPLFKNLELDADGQLPVAHLTRNLRKRPQGEQRMLLNRGLSDLIERALSAAFEVLDEAALERLLERIAGYQQRLGV